MKEAHYWKKILGYTMSESMKMAWRNAKSVVRRNEEAKVKNEGMQREQKIQKDVICRTWLIRLLIIIDQTDIKQIKPCKKNCHLPNSISLLPITCKLC